MWSVGSIRYDDIRKKCYKNLFENFIGMKEGARERLLPRKFMYLFFPYCEEIRGIATSYIFVSWVLGCGAKRTAAASRMQECAV